MKINLSCRDVYFKFWDQLCQNLRSYFKFTAADFGGNQYTIKERKRDTHTHMHTHTQTHT